MRNSVRAPNRAFKLEDRDATTAVRVAVRRARETLLVDVLRGFLAGRAQFCVAGLKTPSSGLSVRSWPSLVDCRIMKSFAQRLAEWRDSQTWTNAATAEYLGKKMDVEVSPRSIEHWIQGRRPHFIWRKKIERIMAESMANPPRTKTINNER